jgi:hypothetical protein
MWGELLAGVLDSENHTLGVNAGRDPREPDVKLNGERHHDHRPSLRCDEHEAMLIYSMSVSVDGFIADREGAFEWTVPSDELFRFHLAQVRELGGYLLGRRLYETMLVWETDPSLRDNEARSAFADVWCAIPVLVGSGTPFLPPVTQDVPLDLVETRTFGSRVIYERHRRARDEPETPPSESSAPRRTGRSPR